MSSTRRARGVCAAILVAVLAVLGGDVVASSVSCTDHCQAPVAAAAPAAPPPAPEPAALSITPAPGADDVDPTKRVLIIAASGTLSGVEMVNENGKSVPGVMTPDNRAWKPTIQLGYGHTYTMTVASRGPSGMPARETSSFTTLTPSDQTEVYFETIGGNALRDGGTYGIGNVIVAHFDEPITDKASAERHLKVTTNPPVAGSWNWISDQVAHWRPEKYYAPGTKVSVEADIYGTPLGGGLYGEDNAKASFTIGDSHVSIADDNTHQVQVFNNGQLVRTMPTSMGMGGYQTIAGTTFSFFTPPGAYTVIDKANPVIMDSSTFGLPTNSRLGYKETISYATKISIDGIYLHQLDSTVWAQGNTDTSHGCLNLNADNASWFFNFAVPGDVVEVKNTGGPPLQISQGGDWTVPWDQWIKGSALSV
ncbi:L,D-transpeptidase [Mycolicibacterium komossense]|uniref:L,D-transpeptidase n=1 Tax=Mycolicibacterium komossense TaxID=1779 RepID=UPI0021F303D2|nr:Ig-like domain-containing protein [Mycolicibacterium komossense]